MINHTTLNTSALTAFNWLHPVPFVAQWKILPEHIDHYRHTNNVAYLTRLEQLAWEHSNALGITFNDYQHLNRAMAITGHELNYHLASHVNDTLLCATWILHCDKKLRLRRQFQYINAATGKTIFSAQTSFVCVSLDTGVAKKCLHFSKPFTVVQL